MKQRDLKFQSLDDLRAEIKRLHAGYHANGKWDLSQICSHIECWMRYPMDGFPRAPLPIAMMMGVMKVFLGRSMFRKIMKNGKMKSGQPTAPDSVFKSDGCTERAAVDRLLKTINRFESWQGPVIPSPLFGKMDRDECERLQLIHCAHHLAFLEPVESHD